MSSRLWGESLCVGWWEGSQAWPGQAQKSEWMDSFICSTMYLQKLKPRSPSFPFRKAIMRVWALESRKGKLSSPFPIFEELWGKLAFEDMCQCHLTSTKYRLKHFTYITSLNLKQFCEAFYISFISISLFNLLSNPIKLIRPFDWWGIWKSRKRGNQSFARIFWLVKVGDPGRS